MLRLCLLYIGPDLTIVESSLSGGARHAISSSGGNWPDHVPGSNHGYIHYTRSPVLNVFIGEAFCLFNTKVLELEAFLSNEIDVP